MTDAREPQDAAAATPAAPDAAPDAAAPDATPAAPDTGSAAVDWESLSARLATAYKTATAVKGKTSARERTRVLHERAEVLSRSLDDSGATEDDLQVLEFSLGDEHYGVESSSVREIYRVKEITPLPGMPPFVLGVVSVRGRICSVVDMGRLFERAAREAKSFKMAVVLASADMEFALLADEIVGTRVMRSADLQADVSSLTGARREYLKGVTTDRMAVLDAARLLGDEKLIVRKET